MFKKLELNKKKVQSKQLAFTWIVDQISINRWKCGSNDNLKRVPFKTSP